MLKKILIASAATAAIALFADATMTPAHGAGIKVETLNIKPKVRPRVRVKPKVRVPVDTGRLAKQRSNDDGKSAADTAGAGQAARGSHVADSADHRMAPVPRRKPDRLASVEGVANTGDGVAGKDRRGRSIPDGIRDIFGTMGAAPGHWVDDLRRFGNLEDRGGEHRASDADRIGPDDGPISRLEKVKEELGLGGGSNHPHGEEPRIGTRIDSPTSNVKDPRGPTNDGGSNSTTTSCGYGCWETKAYDPATKQTTYSQTFTTDSGLIVYHYRTHHPDGRVTVETSGTDVETGEQAFRSFREVDPDHVELDEVVITVDTDEDSEGDSGGSSEEDVAEAEEQPSPYGDQGKSGICFEHVFGSCGVEPLSQTDVAGQPVTPDGDSDDPDERGSAPRVTAEAVTDPAPGGVHDHSGGGGHSGGRYDPKDPSCPGGDCGGSGPYQPN